MNPLERNDDQQFDSEDEISILDILRFFIDGWKTILSFTLIGALIGFGYVTTGAAPQQYKAIAIIEPAYINSAPVESMETLRRKLKSASYYSSETYKACGLEGAFKDGDVLVNRLLTAKKDAPLDQIEFVSNSNDTNINCLNSVLEDIRREQEKDKKRLIDTAKSDLEVLERRLNEAKKLRDSYDDRIANTSLVNLNNYPAGIFFYQSARAESDSSVVSLSTHISSIMKGLADPQTRSARFIIPIYASEVQVDSKRMMKVLAAVFIGLLFSIIYLVGKKYLAKLKKEISKPAPE